LTDLYRLIGFIGPRDNYEDLYLEFAARAVIGFYAPADNLLWVINDSGDLGFDTFDPTLKSTVAHELVHSLQDHAFEVQQLLAQAASDPDWALALSAVIEGDAVHHERLWGADHLAGTPIDEGRRTVSGSGIPAALERELRFPYESGLDWSDLKGSLADNSETNAVLEGRRITTAEVLHPELAEGWQPAVVELPDLTKQLGSDWNQSSHGSFGEFRLRNLLQLRLTGLPAVAGAAGWAGDQYALYQNGDDSVAVLQVAFDSPENADEFIAAMDDWIKASGATTGQPVATLSDGRSFAIRRTSTHTVLLAFGSNIDVTARAVGMQ
jgi:hypothetical protein